MDTEEAAGTTAPSVAPAKPVSAPKPAGEPEEPVPSVPLSGLGDDFGFTRIGEEERRDGEAIALHKTHIC